MKITPRLIGSAALELVIFAASLGGRFGGISGFLYGSIFALPIALAICFIPAVFFLFAYIAFLGIIDAVLGGFAAFLAFLGTLAGAGYLVYTLINRFIQKRLKQAYLENYLPYLNEYKNLPARFNPRLLSNPHKKNSSTTPNTLQTFS